MGKVRTRVLACCKYRIDIESGTDVPNTAWWETIARSFEEHPFQFVDLGVAISLG